MVCTPRTPALSVRSPAGHSVIITSELRSPQLILSALELLGPIPLAREAATDARISSRPRLAD